MRFDQLKRREFTALLGGAAAWPVAAGAQQPAMPVVGFLHDGSFEPRIHLVAAFRQGLSDTGLLLLAVKRRNAARGRHVFTSATASLTASVAILLAAPGRFSIMNGCPKRSDSHWPISRARMSLGPPGGKPEISPASDRFAPLPTSKGREARPPRRRGA
jgi:hypothetical protein